MPAPIRVPRRQLAFALAVTMAAVPILVLDNLPATAETDQGVVATAAAPETQMSIVLLPPSTTTTVAAPTTADAAPAPTEAAPTTTEAPDPAPKVEAQAVRVAAPTTTTPPPEPLAPAPANPKAGDPSDPATWDRLAQCEAGGNWALNTGNGYYGGLQFSLGTWADAGGSGYPHQASRAEQIKRGQILYSRSGWSSWPSCAHKLGYT